MKQYSSDQLLANEIEQVFRQFMYMPNEHSYTVSTLWVMHTHLRSAEGTFLPYITPRLYFGSKMAGCGKSLATELTTKMSHNGEMVLEPTPPSITTMMNQDLSTLGFDEIDTYFGRGTGRGSMRAILNGGYKKGSFVTRQRADECDRLNCHGPICLNGKNANLFMTSEKFETLRTRSISIILEMKPANYEIDRFNPEKHDAMLRDYMLRLKKWGVANARSIISISVDDVMPKAIANRAEEIWTVLFRLAAFLGGEWAQRCEAAARAFVLGEWDEEDVPCVSPAEELLANVRACFLDSDEFLPTAVMLDRLEELPQPTSLMEMWDTERSATMGIARGLAVFGIEHVRQQREGVQVWGYTRESLGIESAPVLAAVA